MFYQREEARIQRGIERARRMRMPGAYIAGEEYRLEQIARYAYVDRCLESIQNGDFVPMYDREDLERLQIASRAIRNARQRGCNMDYVEYRVIRYVADRR